MRNIPRKEEQELPLLQRSYGLMNLICVFWWGTEEEWMISACVVPTVKHRGVVMVRRFFSGVIVGDLIKIQGTIKQQGYCRDRPSNLVWSHHFFSTGQWSKITSRLCKSYLVKKERDASLGLLIPLTWTQWRWKPTVLIIPRMCKAAMNAKECYF